MTSSEYLLSATAKLEDSSIKTARLDSLLLMEYVLNVDRAKLLAEPDTLLTTKQKNVLNHLVGLRCQHIPIAQITHRSEFYGRSFYINEFVLEPRPETEAMIDLFKASLQTDLELINLLKTKGFLKVADVGTGSGAIGISVVLETEKVHVDLIDIDKKALSVAKINVDNFATTVNVVHADLLPKRTEAYDVLLCNLPYVPDDFKINRAAGYEPRIAIFGGLDGLDIYRKLFKVVESLQQKPLYILIEAFPSSHQSLRLIAKSSGYKLRETEGFIQVFKLSV